MVSLIFFILKSTLKARCFSFRLIVLLYSYHAYRYYNSVQKVKAYQNAQEKTESPQQTEYRLFVEVTRALIDAKDCAATDDKLHDALHWNRRMWSTFATDCAVEGNKLPKMLRAQIISLSIWVGKHSSKIIREGEDIQALIDVNKSVMEGLALQEKNAAMQREQAQQQAQPTNQPSPQAPNQQYPAQHRPSSGTSIKV